MNFYEVSLYRDELERSRKKGFRPFLVELDKKYTEFKYLLKAGKYIDSWDENISLFCCQDGKPDDRLANGYDFFLFSDKVIELFDENRITGFQHLPIKIFKMNGNRLEGYNFVANIFKQVECLDLEKSEYEFYGDEMPEWKDRIKIIKKMVLIEAKLPSDLDIFRVKEKASRIIASERLVKLYTENKFNNLAFDNVEIS